MLKRIKAVVKATPFLGPSVVRWHRQRHSRPTPKPQLAFERLPIEGLDAERLPAAQITNLLTYAKASGRQYGSADDAAGYQTIKLDGAVLAGKRDPWMRLAKVPIDFTGKRVLDIGCNAGGMLHAIQDVVKWGVGIDNTHTLINAANRIRCATGVGNQQFYVFDIDKEPLEVILDFLPEPNVDVIFLLAVCHWIEHWRDVIDFSARLSNSMVFESNGPEWKQDEQIAALQEEFKTVRLISAKSEDDPVFDRKMLFCEMSRHLTGSDSKQNHVST